MAGRAGLSGRPSWGLTKAKASCLLESRSKEEWGWGWSTQSFRLPVIFKGGMNPCQSLCYGNDYTALTWKFKSQESSKDRLLFPTKWRRNVSNETTSPNWKLTKRDLLANRNPDVEFIHIHIYIIYILKYKIEKVYTEIILRLRKETYKKGPGEDGE